MNSEIAFQLINKLHFFLTFPRKKKGTLAL